MTALAREALPEALRPLLESDAIKTPRACLGGPGFALAALDSGWITPDQCAGALRAVNQPPAQPGQGNSQKSLERISAQVRGYAFHNYPEEDRAGFLRMISAS